MGAVHGKNQKSILLFSVVAQIANVNAHVSRHTVPRLAEFIVKRHEPGLVRRKVVQRSETNRLDLGLANGAKQVSHKGNGHDRTRHGANSVGAPLKKRAPCGNVFCRRWHLTGGVRHNSIPLAVDGFGSPRSQQCHDIRDILRRQWSEVLRPTLCAGVIRHAEIGPARDHETAQSLVTD